MTRQQLEDKLFALLNLLPGDAVDVDAGHSSVEICINWAKVPDDLEAAP